MTAPVGVLSAGFGGNETVMSTLTAFALNCTLKKSPEPSSTDRLIDLVTDELDRHDVKTRSVRLADYDVRAGVTSDEGDGDEWPELRAAILGADIFILGTPIWLGHPASHAQRALERLDAFLGETDEDDRRISADRVAMIAVVGNEDGAHHVGAELFQGLNDVGFTLAYGAMTYWVGEAMQKKDFQDLDKVPDSVSSTTKTMVSNAVHLAQLAEGRSIPGRVNDLDLRGGHEVRDQGVPPARVGVSPSLPFRTEPFPSGVHDVQAGSSRRRGPRTSARHRWRRFDRAGCARGTRAGAAGSTTVISPQSISVPSGVRSKMRPPRRGSNETCGVRISRCGVAFRPPTRQLLGPDGERMVRMTIDVERHGQRFDHDRPPWSPTVPTFGGAVFSARSRKRATASPQTSVR